MAWLFTAYCEQCSYRTGELLDRGNSLFECRNCRVISGIELPCRRFDLPSCLDCRHQYHCDDLRMPTEDRAPCPKCGQVALRWTSAGHVRLLQGPESEPTVGEIVHGWIKNTGHMQRLEIVRSHHRGRISSDQPQYENELTVEAEVLSMGSRSLDVRIMGSIENPLAGKGGPKRTTQR